MDGSIIKEYLVKIGLAGPDSAEFNRLDSVFSRAELTITSHTTGIARHILEAQGAMVGVFTALSGAILGVADRAAQADLGFQRLGAQMMMRNGGARKASKITK